MALRSEPRGGATVDSVNEPNAAAPRAQAPPPPPMGGAEMPLYLWLVALYFFAFGLQFALYPSLVAFILKASPQEVGWAQMAISAPMAVFLVFFEIS